MFDGVVKVFVLHEVSESTGTVRVFELSAIAGGDRTVSSVEVVLIASPEVIVHGNREADKAVGVLIGGQRGADETAGWEWCVTLTYLLQDSRAA